MEIVVATKNIGKLEEMRRIMQPAGHTLISMAQAGVASLPPEIGASYAENAAAKARAVCQMSGKPALGDDSGLEVDALDGAPGIYSARFSGSGRDEDNNSKLLKLLNRTPYARRSARFVCVVVLAMPQGHVLEARGEVDGIIGMLHSGTGGFGYDSLFYVNNSSFADMSAEQKDKVSHRARALSALMEQMAGGSGQAGTPPTAQPPREGAGVDEDALNVEEN